MSVVLPEGRWAAGEVPLHGAAPLRPSIPPANEPGPVPPSAWRDGRCGRRGGALRRRPRGGGVTGTDEGATAREPDRAPAVDVGPARCARGTRRPLEWNTRPVVGR